MFRIGVILIAIALLNALTGLALSARGRLPRAPLIALVLAATLAVGIGFLLE